MLVRQRGEEVARQVPEGILAGKLAEYGADIIRCRPEQLRQFTARDRRKRLDQR